MIVFAADLKVLPLAVFGIVLAITLGVTYWAAKRTQHRLGLLRRRAAASPASRTAGRSRATTCRPPRSSASPASSSCSASTPSSA